MNVLGLNLLRPNASAALFAGGKLVAAIEEERFSRVKFSAGIPFASIRYCLDRAGLSIEDIDVITFPRSPNIKLCDHDRIHFQERIYRVTSQLDRYRTDLRLIQLRQVLAQELGSSPDRLSFTLTEQDHHRSHILSGLYASSFEKALVVSCDAFGDYVSLKAGVAEGNRLAMNRQVELPHSLGLFYTAITQFLGFRNYGDEAKVMGLSTFGEPEFQDELRKLISWDRSGHQLDLTYFDHENGVGTAWSKSSPDITWLGSSRIAELIGPIREPGGELTAVHKNIAASLQLVTEEILCSMIEDLYEEHRIPNLVLTGGLAYNSLLCSRIPSRTSIEKVFVPPAPGNSGLAIGTALCVMEDSIQRPGMTHAFWGTEYSDSEIRHAFESSVAFDAITSPVQVAVDLLTQGKAIGWFQGRMEFGPRSLGSRCILMSPAAANLARVKKRDYLKPFGVSILADRVGAYFLEAQSSPYMSFMGQVRSDRRSEFENLLLNDYCRYQTVDSDNLLLYPLLEAFHGRTGVPFIVNTSLNPEGFPIIESPRQLVDDLEELNLDAVVAGNSMIRRPGLFQEGYSMEQVEASKGK